MAVKKRDPVTGIETTGHEWDGIEELETPIPKPFIWAYILATLVAGLMWVLLPSWPVMSSGTWPYFTEYYKGLLGFTDQARLSQKLAALARRQASFDKKLTDTELSELVKDNAAREAYYVPGATLFREHCAMCHGRDGSGQPGFPDLSDNQWLWDGEVEGIYTTIKYGINTDHDETQSAEMPGFLKDESLTKDQVADVVEYVLSISGQEHRPEAAKRGATVFEEDGGCSGCHGEGGKGGEGTGAPNLTDSHWLYGGDRASIERSVALGRKGVMPHWVHRLRDAEIRQLALFVKWLNVPEDGDADENANAAANPGRSDASPAPAASGQSGMAPQ